MAELLATVTSWRSLLLVVVVFGFAPGFFLRLIVRAYPRGTPRRDELIAELYTVPRIQRPLWVAEQLEVALFEGLGQRISTTIRRLENPVLRVHSVIVEHQLGLTKQQRPIIIEIEDFLREYGTNVEVRCNLARQDRLVRSYAVGRHRARLAVFGPFVSLWRRDRAVAEAVLLHQIAHYRAGDYRIVGRLSPFLTFISFLLPLCVLLGITPTVAFVVIYPICHLLHLIRRGLAELSADRSVTELGRRLALRRALGTPRPRRRVLARGPVYLLDAVRRWAAESGGHSFGVLLLAGFLLLNRSLLLVLLSSAARQLHGQPWSQIISAAVTNSRGFLVPTVLFVLARLVVAVTRAEIGS
jgi:Zn-dependent protease with chaperone function